MRGRKLASQSAAESLMIIVNDNFRISLFGTMQPTIYYVNNFFKKSLGEVAIQNYLPPMQPDFRMMGYAVLACGENLASFAASPSVILILGFWESDALGDDEMRDDPFSCAIYSSFSLTISWYALSCA